MNKNPGFTLLELTVSVAVSTVIMLVLGGIFLAQGRFFDIQGALSETQINSFRAIDTVGLYASSAKDVVAGRTINSQAYTSGTSTVILELSSINASGAIIANTYDYIALGQNPTNSSQFIFDIDSATGSSRLDGKFVKGLLVDKVIFRYNTVSPSAATVLDLFIQTTKTVRGRTIKTPMGKLYYLGTT